jgi:hypothetical protein
MKIAIITPTRGDREEFLTQREYLMSRQTVTPNASYIVDYKPHNNNKDLTQRYKKGILEAIEDNNDVIFLIEDDDWYREDYIEKTLKLWQHNGSPDVFGYSETWYYDIRNSRAHHMNHPNRASAFMTLVTPKAFDNFRWPPDDVIFLDLEIWKQCKGKSVPLKDILAIGIKHGIGVTGGKGHSLQMRYNMNGANDWFKEKIDEKSYEFYSNQGKS